MTAVLGAVTREDPRQGPSEAKDYRQKIFWFVTLGLSKWHSVQWQGVEEVMPGFPEHASILLHGVSSTATTPGNQFARHFAFCGACAKAVPAFRLTFWFLAAHGLLRHRVVVSFTSQLARQWHVCCCPSHCCFA